MLKFSKHRNSSHGYRQIGSVVNFLIDKKILLKICCEVAKHRHWLQTLACRPSVKSFLAQKFSSFSPLLRLVLVFELLRGKWKNKLPNDWNGQRRETLQQLKTILEEESNLLGKDGFSESLSSPFVSSASLLPRYVRVNTIRMPFSRAIEQLERDGWYICRLKKRITPGKYRKLVSTLERPKIYVDPHIDELLIFPRGVDLHDYKLVMDGVLILQDKASCLSAFVLRPDPDASAMDVCAAPGMKTTHLAALMHNRGKIWAFDRDQKRVELMRQIVDRSGAEIVRAECVDFLRVNLLDERYKEVKFVVVDPPCSGSGMARRGENLDEFEEPDERRINALANLQVMLLRHAFRLPSLQRLVYSTCSVHWSENEGVISEVLSAPTISEHFSLVDTLPQWRHRGQLGQSGNAELRKCLRASPKRDLTNGFFVALFQRTNL